MLPSEELLQSIDILAQNAVKNSVKIYTALVTAVADDGTCSVKVNGKTHSGVAYYGDTPSVNKSYRVFCPNGSMNQAFIITGGGSLPIASADTLGGIKVGAGLSISEQGTLSTTGGGTADAVEWKNVLDKPSTIGGYGITDAKIDGNSIILGNNTIAPYSTNNAPPYPVTSVNGQTGDITIATGGNVDSVNGKTGEVVLTASDVGALSSDTVIPSKTSQLENDSGYITNSSLNGYAKTSDIPTETSQLQNNSGFITADDVPVKSVDGATGDVVTNAVKTTTQNLTDTQKQQARTNIGAGTSSFDGDYNSLSNAPTIPTKTSDITNDSGYITSNDIPVKSVNEQTGAIVLGAEDVGALPDTTIIPNKTSDLTNDSGYITSTALEPYAKAADVPTKTSQLSNDSGYITNAALDGYAKEADIPTNNNQLTNGAGYITAAGAPVQSVNGKTGIITLSASDVGALPDSTVIPSKTSQLDNDSGFITDIPIASATQLGGIKVGGGLSITANGVLSATGGGTADAVEWDNVLDKPTTISGYGITDAKIQGGTITLGNQTLTPLTEAPVISVNSKTGVVVLGASDVGAISTSNISQTLGTSTTKVPSEKAVSDALSAAGAGDMLKSTYDPDGSVATAGGIADYVEANGGKIDTIKINGTTQTITNKTVDIAVPTKTSDLTNDSGYLTSAPVTSVNGKTGIVQLTASDVGALSSDTVIPIVNDATLTIRRNGIDVGSFTANSADDANIDIQVPTDKSDIGLGNVDNVKQYSATNPPPYPVTSVNGKTGDVTIDVSGGGTQVKIVRW